MEDKPIFRAALVRHVAAVMQVTERRRHSRWAHVGRRREAESRVVLEVVRKSREVRRAAVPPILAG
jgi:hypothetical protein